MSPGLIIAAAVFLPGLLGILLLGIAAYRGRWHSWHGNDTFFHWPYTPLSGTWFAASALLIVMTFVIASHVPGAVVAFLALVAGLLGLTSIVVYVHPPRWMLPRYVRWLDGDAGITERPTCLDTYKDSRLNRVMRTLTLDPREH
ncbi:hypothetical protein GCM10022254_41140 [Actinomadura meridiana]|uniref:Uncharacterized protein n=1 Tax=Actinomadura meridiana TaxID=559626 RepID=A0ABP8C7C6_9ACTN